MFHSKKVKKPSCTLKGTNPAAFFICIRLVIPIQSKPRKTSLDIKAITHEKRLTFPPWLNTDAMLISCIQVIFVRLLTLLSGGGTKERVY